MTEEWKDTPLAAAELRVLAHQEWQVKVLSENPLLVLTAGNCVHLCHDSAAVEEELLKHRYGTNEVYERMGEDCKITAEFHCLLLDGLDDLVMIGEYSRIMGHIPSHLFGGTLSIFVRKEVRKQ